MQGHQRMHARSFQQLLTQLRKNERRHARVCGINSYINEAAYRTGPFSKLFSKLRARPLIIFVAITLLFLLLSIACDKVLGQNDAPPSATHPADARFAGK